MKTERAGMLTPRTIFQTRHGKSLVLEAEDGFLVVVEVAEKTTRKHRADYYLSYSASIRSGVLSDTPIRCIPKRIKSPYSPKVLGEIDREEFDEIRAIAAAELATMLSEQRGRKSVSGVYRW